MTAGSDLAPRRRLAVLSVAMAALVFLGGACAALRKTENLPSPSAEDSLGGPEGETDPGTP